MVEKAYKFRFYQTPEQENLLGRTLGCVRLIYNKALAARTQAWYEKQERVGYAQTSAMLTSWKKHEDLDFLIEVSSVPLQLGLRHLQTAFTNFFSGRAKYPNFKKKRNGGSPEFTLVCIQVERWSSLRSLNVLNHYLLDGVGNYHKIVYQEQLQLSLTPTVDGLCLWELMTQEI